MKNLFVQYVVMFMKVKVLRSSARYVKLRLKNSKNRQVIRHGLLSM